MSSMKFSLKLTSALSSGLRLPADDDFHPIVKQTFSRPIRIIGARIHSPKTSV